MGNLLDSNGGFPALVGIKEAQTHSARRIDVGMEQNWFKSTDWRLFRIIFAKFYVEMVYSAFPEPL